VRDQTDRQAVDFQVEIFIVSYRRSTGVSW